MLFCAATKTNDMKKLLPIIVFLFASYSSQAQLNYTYAQRLNQVFDSVCQKLNIKGATVAIIDPHEGLWERAYGISHQGTPITTDMYLGLGSNTKTYAAVTLLKLQEQGQLDLDDTIGQWVTHQHIPGNITIRQLLNHTSGLYSFTSNSKINDYIIPDYTRVWPIDSVLNLVEAPVSAPGGSWDYCNTNYTVAGLIIRAVTGKSTQEAMRDIVLNPAQLNETFLYPFEQPTGTIPHVWSANLSGNGTYQDINAQHNYSHSAFLSLANTAGGYMSTARDNAKFWDMLMGGNILNSTSMQELQTNVPISLGQGYGLGIFSMDNFNGDPIVSHGGTGIGFINENIYDKTTGVTITVLTNQDSIGNSAITNNIVRALHLVTKRYTDVNELHATNKNIKVYPNPASNFINLTVERDNSQLQIYDVRGVLVKEQQLMNGNNSIDISSINTGSYFLSISSNDRPAYRQTIQVVK